MFYMAREAVAANTKDRDILNGTQIQRIGPAGGKVSIAAVATQLLDVEIFIGERQVIEDAQPRILAATDPSGTNPSPVGPDHPEIPFDLILNEEPAAPGEYIVLNAQAGSNAATLYYRINVEPL